MLMKQKRISNLPGEKKEIHCSVLEKAVQLILLPIDQSCGSPRKAQCEFQQRFNSKFRSLSKHSRTSDRFRELQYLDEESEYKFIMLPLGSFGCRPVDTAEF